MVEAGHTRLARGVSSDVGMEFRAHAGREANGDRWIRLTPAAVPDKRAFDVRVQMTWRRVRLAVEPQVFAGEFVRAMGESDRANRKMFRTILEESVERGATVQFGINGNAVRLDDEAVWGKRWRRFELKMSKRLSGFDGGATAEELDVIRRWTRRFLAAILAIAPLEAQQTTDREGFSGFMEGTANITSKVGYERDRRNRAAAIAIHGTACLACGLEFGTKYGEIADGFIEVHHIIPLAKMGEGYIVNPAEDLVPLCPNCHAVAHRRDPPLTVDEIRNLLRE